MAWLERGAPGWREAWEGLARLGYVVPTDHEEKSCPACHLESGECWQYMGTITRGGDPVAVHEFRHRAYPPTGERVNVRVLACARCLAALQEVAPDVWTCPRCRPFETHHVCNSCTTRREA